MEEMCSSCGPQTLHCKQTLSRKDMVTHLELQRERKSLYSLSQIIGLRLEREIALAEIQ